MTAQTPVSETKPDKEFCVAMRDEIGTHWAAVWKAMPEAIAGKGPEGVHKMRVESRRLRAAMDVSADCFPGTWYRPLHRRAKRITKVLGDVRDRDVLLEALATEQEHASDVERRGIDHLVPGIRRGRKKARKAMIRFVTNLENNGIPKQTKRQFSPTGDRKKTRTREAPDARRVTTSVGPSDSEAQGTKRSPTRRALALPSLDPEAPMEANARHVLTVRTEDLFRYGSIIRDAEATEALHDARIATKRLRYTLELFPFLYQDHGEQVVRQLKDLQEELGQVHDHDVWIAMIDDELSSLGNDERKKARSIREGLEALLQRERIERAACHSVVVARWKRLEDEHTQDQLSVLARPRSLVTATQGLLIASSDRAHEPETCIAGPTGPVGEPLSTKP